MEDCNLTVFAGWVCTRGASALAGSLVPAVLPLQHGPHHDHDLRARLLPTDLLPTGVPGTVAGRCVYHPTCVRRAAKRPECSPKLPQRTAPSSSCAYPSVGFTEAVIACANWFASTMCQHACLSQTAPMQTSTRSASPDRSASVTRTEHERLIAAHPSCAEVCDCLGSRPQGLCGRLCACAHGHLAQKLLPLEVSKEANSAV